MHDRCANRNVKLLRYYIILMYIIIYYNMPYIIVGAMQSIFYKGPAIYQLPTHGKENINLKVVKELKNNCNLHFSIFCNTALQK